MFNNSQDIAYVVIYFTISGLLSFAFKCMHENNQSVNTKMRKKTPELKKNIQMFLL